MLEILVPYYVAEASHIPCPLTTSPTTRKNTEESLKPEVHPLFFHFNLTKGFVTDGRIDGNLNLSRCIGDFEYKKDS
jgi:hypothetical protein